MTIFEMLFFPKISVSAEIHKASCLFPLNPLIRNIAPHTWTSAASAPISLASSGTRGAASGVNRDNLNDSHIPAEMQQVARSDIFAAANGAEASALSQRTLWALTLGAIGVVYGDIGTSPLYAFREAVLAAGGAHAPPSDEAILGILSLIVWALILVVSVKYVVILLRADNKSRASRRRPSCAVFPAPPCSSPRIWRVRRPPFSTASSTTRHCTRTMSS